MTTKRRPTTPGVILEEEFMAPLGMTQGELADRLGIARRRVNEIIGGKRDITSDTASRLAKAFGVSAMFWLNLQMAYNLWKVEQNKRKEYAAIKPIGPRTNKKAA